MVQSLEVKTNVATFLGEDYLRCQALQTNKQGFVYQGLQ